MISQDGCSSHRLCFAIYQRCRTLYVGFSAITQAAIHYCLSSVIQPLHDANLFTGNLNPNTNICVRQGLLLGSFVSAIRGSRMMGYYYWEGLPPRHDSKAVLRGLAVAAGRRMHCGMNSDSWQWRRRGRLRPRACDGGSRCVCVKARWSLCVCVCGGAQILYAEGLSLSGQGVCSSVSASGASH